MKIYAVEYTVDGTPKTRLIKAESLAQARGHVLKIASAHVATQEDLVAAIDGSTTIENVGDDPVLEPEKAPEPEQAAEKEPEKAGWLTRGRS